MTDSQTKFKVFYSWQSDLPNETNRSAIRSALRAASSIVEGDYKDTMIVLDEATRGEPGSPNIPSTILDKIRTSDAFVCDITTVNSDAPNNFRRTPNPNVIFELGYAVAHLGWGRIVMLFNEELGNFPEDTPFDIDRHRASPYKLSLSDSKNKSNKNNLTNLVSTSINSILNKQPQKPFELLKKSPDEIKRIRDIENIKWAMNTIHIPTIDDMYLQLPHSIQSKSLHFWESFNGVITNSLFHIYDKELSTAILSVHRDWNECISHGEQYHMAANPNLNIFSNPGDMPLNKRQQKVWDKIESASASLKLSLSALLKIIREFYLEVNIDDTNKNAWDEYITSQKAMEERFEQ